MPKPKIDIQISNSGSGFFGIHGESAKGLRWVNEKVYGANLGSAWCDNIRLAKDIVQAALDDGLSVA